MQQEAIEVGEAMIFTSLSWTANLMDLSSPRSNGEIQHRESTVQTQVQRSARPWILTSD